MSNNDAMIVADNGMSILPRNLEARINEAVAMREALNKLFESALEMGKDFDRIPGTDKPTLLKPGAEMLCKIFRLGQGKADVIDKSEDWERGVFSYTIGMPLIFLDTGEQVSYGVGAANSMEKKYRYRKAKDAEGREIQIENPDPADLQNTLIKMANKRAFVDAVLKATGANRMFTQDMEDFGAATGHFERASSKQIGFLKTFFNGVSGADAMAEISGICGREVASFEDIYRSEASRIIDAKRSGAGPSRAPSGGPDVANGTALVCANCGSTITNAEHNYSKSKFGRPLCRNCQSAEKSRPA